MEIQGLLQPFVQYDISHKTYIHETSRPIGTTTCFTSEGDDVSDPKRVGGGQSMRIIHEIGNPLLQSIYIDSNVKQNKTFAHEGYIIWHGADFDELTLETVPAVTPYIPSGSTNFNVLSNGIVLPANGDGNAEINNNEIKLVEMPPYEMEDGKRPMAFWNATYDEATNIFSNITPAPNGDGIYNIFTQEISINRFANNILLIDNGFLMLQTADSSEIGHGMRFKISIKTNGQDHAWKAACILTLHRTRTC